MSSPGAERDPARPSHDPLFEDPSETPPVLATPRAPASAPKPPLNEPATAARDAAAAAPPAAAAQAPAAVQAAAPPHAEDGPVASPLPAAAESPSPRSGQPGPLGPPAGSAVALAPPAGAEPATSAATPESVALVADDGDAETPHGGPDAAAGLAAAVRTTPPPRVDTGRLFRSSTADGPATSDAIPALTAEQLLALRSVSSPGAAVPPPPGGTGGPPAAGTALAGAALADAAAASGTGVAADGRSAGSGDGPAPVSPPARSRHSSRARGTFAHAGATGLTATGVWVVTIGVTVLLAFADALLPPKGLSWITGLGLVVASVYCALTVRRDDLWIAVIAPPLAYLAAVLTAGQLTLSGGGGFLVREAVMVFSTLSFNAPWILGATAAALIIVLVRRRPTPSPTA